MKKSTSVILAVLLLAAAAVAAAAAMPKRQTGGLTIGVCEFAQHDSLTMATQGFKDALADHLAQPVIFDEQNAHGDLSVCTAILNDFVAKDVDLILANSTNALQLAATATTEIPILGTSVTEYGAALQREGFNGTVGGNISGTSDIAPLGEQAAMVKELFPEAKRVGLLYCSAEANSQYQVEVVQAELQAMGYLCERYPFADSNDLSAVAARAAEECDVLYLPTDNTVAANAQLIANVCLPAKMPVVAGDEGVCRSCGVATLSIDYYAMGYKTGEMAARILSGEGEISAMPVEYADGAVKLYNAEICEALGITVPQGYQAL